jgi:5-carboxymethyl-2-hydroxymuconate isomerase
MQGRSPAVKAQLAAQLLNALEACIVNQPNSATQLCVEIIEIDNASYAKKVVGV